MRSKLASGRSKAALLLAAVLGTSLMAACSSTPSQQSTGEAIDDGVAHLREARVRKIARELFGRNFLVRSSAGGVESRSPRLSASYDSTAAVTPVRPNESRHIPRSAAGATIRVG